MSKGDLRVERLGTGIFPETQWTLIRGARTEDGDFGRWCEGYWRPAREYLRALGCKEDEAAEITQDFFCKVLEKGVERVLPEHLEGSFRAYLKRSIRNFLIDRRRSENSLRRGSAAVHIPVEDLNVAADESGPAQHFDREWVIEVMNRAMMRLSGEIEQAGQCEFFDAVKPLLDGRDADRDALAREFGMSCTAFRAALYRLRKRYRKLIHDEIRSTVSSEDEFRQELNYLLGLWN